MATDTEVILVDASVEVDDEPITLEGNTLKFREGQGTSTVKAASRGGRVIMVPSEDITTKVGMIELEMPSSVSALNLARDIKARGPGRTVAISGKDSQGNVLSRTLVQATMVNDPDKAIENEGTQTLTFEGAPLQAG